MQGKEPLGETAETANKLRQLQILEGSDTEYKILRIKGLRKEKTPTSEQGSRDCQKQPATCEHLTKGS